MSTDVVSTYISCTRCHVVWYLSQTRLADKVVGEVWVRIYDTPHACHTWMACPACMPHLFSAPNPMPHVWYNPPCTTRA